MIIVFPKGAGQLSAPWASLVSEVGNLMQLLPQLERLLGEKPRLFGQSSARWFTAERYLKIEGAHALLELIFFLVSLLDSTQVGIHQFQHVLPYYPLQVKTKGDWVHFCGKKQVAVIRARGREMAAMLRIQSGPLGVAQSSPPNL